MDKGFVVFGRIGHLMKPLHQKAENKDTSSGLSETIYSANKRKNQKSDIP